MKLRHFHIITRTSGRPYYFDQNYQSVKEQSYPLITHIVTYDDPKTYEYLSKYDDLELIDVSHHQFNIKKHPYSFPYNEYLNDGIKYVLDHHDEEDDNWIMFLDDDDILLKSNSIELLDLMIDSDVQFCLWKVLFPTRTVPRRVPTKIVVGQVSCIGFAFDINIFKDQYDSDSSMILMFDREKGGDYRFIKKMEQLVGEPFWIKEVLTGINYTKNRQMASGKRNDLGKKYTSIDDNPLFERIMCDVDKENNINDQNKKVMSKQVRFGKPLVLDQLEESDENDSDIGELQDEIDQLEQDVHHDDSQDVHMEQEEPLDHAEIGSEERHDEEEIMIEKNEEQMGDNFMPPDDIQNLLADFLSNKEVLELIVQLNYVHDKFLVITREEMQSFLSVGLKECFENLMVGFLEHKVEQILEHKVEQILEHKVEQILEHKVEQILDNKLDKMLDTVIEKTTKQTLITYFSRQNAQTDNHPKNSILLNSPTQLPSQSRGQMPSHPRDQMPSQSKNPTTITTTTTTNDKSKRVVDKRAMLIEKKKSLAEKRQLMRQSNKKKHQDRSPQRQLKSILREDDDDPPLTQLLDQYVDLNPEEDTDIEPVTVDENDFDINQYLDMIIILELNSNGRQMMEKLNNVGLSNIEVLTGNSKKSFLDNLMDVISMCQKQSCQRVMVVQDDLHLLNTFDQQIIKFGLMLQNKNYKIVGISGLHNMTSHDVKFDPNYYLELYPDLSTVGKIDTNEKAIKHWKQYGNRREKRYGAEGIFIPENYTGLSGVIFTHSLYPDIPKLKKSKNVGEYLLRNYKKQCYVTSPLLGISGKDPRLLRRRNGHNMHLYQI